METCLDITEIYYKDVSEYKVNTDLVIENMIAKNERLVFAVIAEKAGITRFVVRQYPELRNYILQKMKYYKEMQVINQKIDRAVNSLIKSNKTLTFMSIINKCKLSSNIIYEKEYIKNRIRNILIKNKTKKL